MMRKNLTLILMLYLLLFFVVGILLGLFLFRLTPYDDGRVAMTHETLAHYGDFITGVFGTFFAVVSVIFVVGTFNSQRNQAELERFNNLFFEMIRLYHQKVDDLNQAMGQKNKPNQMVENNLLVLQQLILPSLHSEQRSNSSENFFSSAVNMMWEDFSDPSLEYEDNYSRCLEPEYNIYKKYEAQLSSYFRTVYRIYQLIEDAKINEEEKKNYAKIVRAQFSSNELILLRYNARSLYGTNSIKYLVNYNVTKHIPVFDLLEFKYWAQKLDFETRKYVNVVFDSWKEKIDDIIENRPNDQDPSLSKRYVLEFSQKSKQNFIIKLSFDKRADLSDYQPNNFLNAYSQQEVKNLLKAFAEEVFMGANYGQLNKKIRASCHVIDTRYGYDIVCDITRTDNNPLLIKPNHPQGLII